MKKGKSFTEVLTSKAKDLETHSECNSRIIDDAMIHVRFTDGHIHHLLPRDSQIKDQIISSLIAAEGISLDKPSSPTEQRPIIFKNRQAIGDILMFTTSVRDFKKAYPDWPVNVQSTAFHLWDNNPYLDRSLTVDNAEVIEIGPGYLTNASNRDDRHFANAFRISMEDKLGISIPQGPIKPDIWMTEEEISSPIIDPPYWIIVAGEKGDWTAKTYPFKRWKEFVEHYPYVKFVQIGAKEHNHPSLPFDNVIDFIGKTQDKDTGVRDLFKLFYFAEGSIGLVSFQMHLAAAFGMPCIVIAGAREPARFTRYPGHQYLCTDGCLPCSETNACWHCKLEKTCKDVVEDGDQKYPKCVDIIKTEDVIRAFDQLYEGGRLSFDYPRKPTLPNGIVKSEKIKEEKEGLELNLVPKKNSEEQLISEFGFEFGGAHITDKDWIFLKSVIEEENIRTVLEFGSGLSTVLFSNLGIKVVSYESEEHWMRKLEKKGIDKIADLRLWNGDVLQDELEEFDLVFVDGPPGGKRREISTRIASEKGRIVIIHDAGREWERKWQDKYLKDSFTGPGKGGHRCHLWKRGSAISGGKEVVVAANEVDACKVNSSLGKLSLGKAYSGRKISSGNKIFRILFNGRGRGGAESSTTFIMNSFVDLGWNVEYVCPNGSPSGTFRDKGSPRITVCTDLNALRPSCDVLLLYVNDWVWEFNKPEISTILENVNADRKIMAVNYRMGDIGKIPWTREWDLYLFLNSSLEKLFIEAYMKSCGMDSYFSFKTKSMAPPIDLSEYFINVPNYSGSMKIVRHSSQGNAKYAKDFNDKIKAILNTFPDSTINLMPAPSFLDNFGERVVSHKRNDPSIREFLLLGNVFWYDLPDGYHDMGPKVIMEAQAAGLPVIANNHSGPKDRVVKGTGFLYNDFEDSMEMFRSLNDFSERERMGKTARKHAMAEYGPQKWINEIMGE